ncbi:hypothetical protein FRC11_010537 [Ceratobasidium sp. 423]|nr:hypothetical protein FRC11_010537 [Ceratobasidium sp. 423]
MITTTLVPIAVLVVSTAGAAVQNGVYELSIGFGQGRHDDQYATVDGDFDGQKMPLLLDTGSSDTFIASDKCTIYVDTINVTNYNYEGQPLTRQFWNANVTSLRFNGQDIPLFGSLQEELVIGLLDTGASDVMCRPASTDAIVAAIDGTKHSNGHDIFIECDKPQIMEFQIGENWYPINPIDLITPGVTADYNGTTFCRASIGSWSRTGGDCIIGLPFFRNVYTVFDYVNSDFQPQPRVGLASTTNIEQALKEFPSKWKTRML